ETDRRVSRRLSRARPESSAGPHGRLSADGSRRAVPRKIPQRLLQSSAVHARQAGKNRVLDARRFSHLQDRSSHHGADPKLLVPADRSQSAEVFGYPESKAVRFSESHRAHLSRRSRRLAHQADGDRVSRSLTTGAEGFAKKRIFDPFSAL